MKHKELNQIGEHKEPQVSAKPAQDQRVQGMMKTIGKPIKRGRVIDAGFVDPSDPMFSEGWTIGSSFASNVSTLLGLHGVTVRPPSPPKGRSASKKSKRGKAS